MKTKKCQTTELLPQEKSTEASYHPEVFPTGRAGDEVDEVPFRLLHAGAL